MNTSLLDEDIVKEKLREQWDLWKQQRSLYPDLPIWWGRYAKKEIRQFFTQEGSEPRRDLMRIENFYY
jgi:hypothetical protein